MDDLSSYHDRPFAFVFRFIRRRGVTHTIVLAAVLAAVISSVSTQYGVKFLVDTLASREIGSDRIWSPFLVVVALIAADSLFWRVAGWVGNMSFVGVTGDLRRDLFRYLTGHAPSYFSEHMPGTLASRISATSTAVFTMENMLIWNVLPPCAATVTAIAFVMTISGPMAAALAALAGLMVAVMFYLAATGRPLHHDFADKAAAVDGETVDVISNMPLVRAFCGFVNEHRRYDATIEREMSARRRSLLYLERLRALHAAVTVGLTIGLLAWAIVLWQHGAVTTGDVVLACTLGMSVLRRPASAYRDRARLS